MRDVLVYFRQHPWQRRAILASLIVLLALLVTVLLAPMLIDAALIYRLGLPDDVAHMRAVQLLADRAQVRVATRRRLIDALATTNDRRFYGAAAVLKRIGAFYTPDRRGDALDRMAALSFEATDSPRSRWLILHGQCVADRDNAWQRRLADAASLDEKPAVRELSAVLAAKLASDDALARLLEDPIPAVRTAAVLDAGLARRRELSEPIAALLDDANDDVVGAAAWALARLAPAENSQAICDRYQRAEAEALRDLLLEAMIVLSDANARRAFNDAHGMWRTAGARQTLAPPSAMVILAAGALDPELAAEMVGHVLDGAAAATDYPVTNIQLFAALETARRLDLPVRSAVYKIINAHWGPAAERPMAIAADYLAQLAEAPDAETTSPTRNECIKALQQAAVWSYRQDDPTDDQPPETIATPLASAAATVALWRLEAPLADAFVRNVAAGPYTLPGDSVTWHLARSDRPGAAYELGLAMLPAADAPPELRVFNDNERAAGAMLLALAARGDTQRKAAADRILQRLEGVGMGGEDDPFVRHAYECALLALGQRERLERVRALLSVSQFPQRRVVTALLAAGDRQTLDWLCWNVHLGPDSLLDLLAERGIQDVTETIGPDLPRIDPAAPYEVRLRQARILCDAYAIGHASVQIGASP